MANIYEYIVESVWDRLRSALRISRRRGPGRYCFKAPVYREDLEELLAAYKAAVKDLRRARNMLSQIHRAAHSL